MNGEDPDELGTDELELYLNGVGEWGVPEPLIRRGVRALLESEGVTAGELSITFLGDSDAQALNRTYLAHDWVPDVLSFPMSPPLLGDIYIGVEQARRQAVTHAVTETEELLRLAIHGTLHMLGYDHPEAPELRETCEMMELQEAWVRRLMGPEGSG